MLYIILIIAALIIAVIIYVAIYMKRFMPSKVTEHPAVRTDGGTLITIDGFDIWTKVLGADKNGIPLYVIPGGMGMKSKYMEDYMISISENSPVIFYDPRGCGRSSARSSPSNYTWAAFADELYKLIQHYTPRQKVCIAAHSAGCAILYEFLKKYSDITDKVIFISCMPPKYEADPPPLKILLKMPPADPKKADLWMAELLKTDVMFGSMFYDKSLLDKLDTDKCTMIMSVINMKSNKPYDHTGEYSNYQGKVLVLCGDDRFESKSTSRSCAKKIAAAFKNSETVFIDNCGHFPFMEKPVEFSKAVKEFLSK